MNDLKTPIIESRGEQLQRILPETSADQVEINNSLGTKSNVDVEIQLIRSQLQTIGGLDAVTIKGTFNTDSQDFGEWKIGDLWQCGATHDYVVGTVRAGEFLLFITNKGENAAATANDVVIIPSIKGGAAVLKDVAANHLVKVSADTNGRTYLENGPAVEEITLKAVGITNVSKGTGATYATNNAAIQRITQVGGSWSIEVDKGRLGEVGTPPAKMIALVLQTDQADILGVTLKVGDDTKALEAADITEATQEGGAAGSFVLKLDCAQEEVEVVISKAGLADLKLAVKLPDVKEAQAAPVDTGRPGQVLTVQDTDQYTWETLPQIPFILPEGSFKLAAASWTGDAAPFSYPAQNLTISLPAGGVVDKMLLIPKSASAFGVALAADNPVAGADENPDTVVFKVTTGTKPAAEIEVELVIIGHYT